MLRISQYLREVAEAERTGRYPSPPPARSRGPVRPVVIWNLTRRCNLTCKHCYALSADHAYPGELDEAQMLAVLEDLKAYGVPALILSGGDPLEIPSLTHADLKAFHASHYHPSQAVFMTSGRIDPIAVQRVITEQVLDKLPGKAPRRMPELAQPWNAPKEATILVPSPTANSGTAGPGWTTTPETSQPGITGNTGWRIESR